MTTQFKTMLTIAVVVGVTLAAPTPEISTLRNVSLANDSSSTIYFTGDNVSSTKYGPTGESTSTGKPMIPITGGYINSGQPKVPHCHESVGDHGCSFFDSIIAIGIKIWQAIINYLTKKQLHPEQSGFGCNYGQGYNGTSENRKADTPPITQKKTSYDKLFNILFTAWTYMFHDEIKNMEELDI